MGNVVHIEAISRMLVFILQDECTVVSSPVTSRTPHNESLSYSVKVINPSKKTDYSLRKFRVSVCLATMGDMKKALAESFPTFITKESELEFGYIAPGHGVRGQQRWIADDIDLQDMYAEYRGKEITLWFFVNKDVAKGKKRAHSPGGGGPSKKPLHQSDAHKAKMEEADEILE